MQFPHRIFAATLALLLSASTLRAETPEWKIEDLKSPGGISFSYVQMPDAKKVSISAAWHSNWAARGLQAAAPSVGAELMMSGGAGDREPADVASDLEAANAKAQIAPDSDAVRGKLSADPAQLDEATAIIADVLARPTLDQRWFARIKTSQSASIRESRILLSNQTGRLIENLVFNKSPLAKVFSLPPEIIEQLDLAATKEWHKSIFTRANLEVAVAGPLPPQRMAEVVDRIFGGLPQGVTQQQDTFPAPAIPHVTVLLHMPGSPKSYFAGAGTLPPLGADADIATFFGSLALGEGETARLNAAVRKELRASYGVSAGIANLTRDIRLLYVEGEIETAKMPQAIHVLRSAYEELRTKGLTQQEFDGLKKKVTTFLEEARTHPGFVSDSIVEAKLSQMPPARGLAMLHSVSTASLSDVNAKIAKDFPPFDDMIKVVAMPDVKSVPSDRTIEDPDQVAACLK